MFRITLMLSVISCYLLSYQVDNRKCSQPLTRAIWSAIGRWEKPGIALTKLTNRLTQASMFGMTHVCRISRRPSTSIPVTSNTLLYSSPVSGFISPKISCFNAFCSCTVRSHQTRGENTARHRRKTHLLTEKETGKDSLMFSLVISSLLYLVEGQKGRMRVE